MCVTPYFVCVVYTYLQYLYVCMYVCVYVSFNGFSYALSDAFSGVRHFCVCMHTCLCVCMYLSLRVCVYGHSFHENVYLYVCMHMCTNRRNKTAPKSWTLGAKHPHKSLTLRLVPWWKARSRMTCWWRSLTQTGRGRETSCERELLTDYFDRIMYWLLCLLVTLLTEE